jgi:hypothetical protein
MTDMPLNSLTLFDPEGTEVELGSLTAASPTLWVFLRHYG